MQQDLQIAWFDPRSLSGEAVGGLVSLGLALAQPIRSDDVVVVEGEWGRVEEMERLETPA